MEIKTFQEKFIQIIIPVFEGSIEDRKKYYLENEKPGKEQVEGIISSCSTTNGTISGISGMLPGPAGLIAIIPELKLTIENQIVMIYDIGVANGNIHTAGLAVHTFRYGQAGGVVLGAVDAQAGRQAGHGRGQRTGCIGK